MIQVTDHTPRGLARLATQFQGQPQLAALLSAFLDEVQAAEDALWTMVSGFVIGAATGVQLDTIGAILGMPRNGLDDPTYTLYLRAQMLILVSAGEVETLLQIFRLTSGGAVTAQESTIAAVLVTIGQATTSSGATQAAILRRAAAAGVQVSLEWLNDTADNTFSFLEDPTGLGFDDGTGHVGGVFASIL
jgi:hypothetical protein